MDFIERTKEEWKRVLETYPPESIVETAKLVSRGDKMGEHMIELCETGEMSYEAMNEMLFAYITLITPEKILPSVLDKENEFIEECFTAIQQALKEFGSYTFLDKGASEVMDVDVIAKKIRAMSEEESGRILEKIALSNEYGERLVCDLLYELQDVSSTVWEHWMSIETLDKVFA